MGPVELKIFRDNGAVKSKGEYSDTLSIIVQCVGRPGSGGCSVDMLVEVDTVTVEVAN